MTTSERQMMIFFLRRQRPEFTAEEAAAEADRLAQCENMKQYLKISRAGSTIPLDRPTRAGIWSLYRNAKKHAAANALEDS